jgi:hypothetical protein
MEEEADSELWSFKKKNRNIWSTSLTTLGHHSLTPSHQQPNQTQHVIK